MCGRRIVVISILVTLATCSAVARDIAVVSNKTNSVQDLSVPDLVKVCKGQTVRWPDGKPVTFVMMPPGHADMKTVAQKLYEARTGDIQDLVTAANHERKNHPAIVIVDSPEAVVQKVEATPGAVGVVDVYSITSGVTVLKIAGKLPLEPGYALHGN